MVNDNIKFYGFVSLVLIILATIIYYFIAGFIISSDIILTYIIVLSVTAFIFNDVNE